MSFDQIIDLTAGVYFHFFNVSRETRDYSRGVFFVFVLLVWLGITRASELLDPLRPLVFAWLKFAM